MAISIQNLFNLTVDKYRLKFIAGNKGSNHPVSWMYYSEDISTLNFIRGGELVITTGLSIERRRDNSGADDESFVVEYLSNLVTSLFEHKASGLIINIGKYITSVPDEILELCERLQFPLLTLPWEIHIIDIMQDYGKRIVNDREKGNTIGKSLFNAIFNISDFELIQLNNTPFANATNFSVVLLEMPPEFEEKEEEEITRYLEYSFNIKTGLHPGEYCMLLCEGKVCYVFHSDGHEAAKNIENVAKKDPYFKNSKISISGVCSTIHELSSEYRHAKLALDMCEIDKTFCDYNNLGIYQILGDVQDRKILERIYENTLGSLKVFAQDKMDDYLNTMRLYLSSSGRVQKTAEENSTHRNTVNYRIRKICEVLGIDIQDGEVRYMIQTALYIQKLLEKTKK